MKLKLFTSNLHIELKKTIVKSVSWSVVLYTSETWSMTQADRKRSEAMEMWIWRRMEKISWVDKISNDEVLQRVNETETMLDIVGKNANVWLGHVLRHESLLHDIIEKRTRWKAIQGRKRMHLLSDLIKRKYVALKKNRWRQERVAEIVNSWKSYTCFSAMNE